MRSGYLRSIDTARMIIMLAWAGASLVVLVAVTAATIKFVFILIEQGLCK